MLDHYDTTQIWYLLVTSNPTLDTFKISHISHYPAATHSQKKLPKPLSTHLRQPTCDLLPCLFQEWTLVIHHCSLSPLPTDLYVTLYCDIFVLLLIFSGFCEDLDDRQPMGSVCGTRQLHGHLKEDHPILQSRRQKTHNLVCQMTMNKGRIFLKTFFILFKRKAEWYNDIYHIFHKLNAVVSIHIVMYGSSIKSIGRWLNIESMLVKTKIL